MNDNDFDEFLRNNTTPVTIPGSFRHTVWHRIEVSRPVPWFGVFLTKLTQPVGAGILAAMALAIGSLIGTSMPGGENDARISYLESVSPFANQKR